MSNRYWLLGLAIGGWLAVGAALPGEGVTQTPERERVAGGGPPNEEKSGGQTNDRQHPSREFAIPFRVVEDPTDALRAQEREAKADQREADDLDAQQRAAVAAERGAVAAEGQEKAAWAQSVFGLVSVILVFCALRQTNRSLKIARDANQLTREQMIASQRAWVEIENAYVKPATGFNPAGFTIAIQIDIKNVGLTPALSVGVAFELFLLSERLADSPEHVVDERLLSAAAGRAKINSCALHDAVGLVIFPQREAKKSQETTIEADKINPTTVRLTANELSVGI
jgi:hypothetical protein